MIEEWVIGDLMNLALEGPRRLAIDVGANIGEWSRWLSGRFGCVVAVEPDPRATAMFQHMGVPQKCFILPVACGDSCRMDEYQIRHTHEQSSLLREHPIGGADQAEVKTVAAVPVRVVTLDWIADTFASDSIDLLKIDVEGMEEAVLRGWDPKALRPWIVVVEATRPNSMEPAHHGWEHLLLDAGYRFVHFDGLNRFYVAAERPELAAAFSAGVNIHDLAGGCELADSSPFVAGAVGRAHATIGRMRASRSWRWTRPLRALHSLVTGAADPDREEP